MVLFVATLHLRRTQRPQKQTGYQVPNVNNTVQCVTMGVGMQEYWELTLFLQYCTRTGTCTTVVTVRSTDE